VDNTFFEELERFGMISNLGATLLSISVGASMGAILRWWLGTQLNSLFPTIPPGTLVANAIGGYLIGVAVAYLGNHPELSPQWRLLIVTGFLGGLTTFSTFSAEVVTLLQQGRLMWACGAIATHVGTSLVMTLLGIGTVAVLSSKV
jgi:CrcB protein